MRIGTKLLLTYLLLISMLTAVASLLLPRWVQAAVIATEEARLDRQVQVLADRITVRIRRPLEELLSARQTLAFVEELLTDEMVAVVDPNGLAVLATRPDLAGKVIPNAYLLPLQERSRFLQDKRPEIAGIGPVILASAPLSSRGVFKDYHVVMVRDMSFVLSLAGPITQRLYLVILLVLAVALLVGGWLSRDLVGRLKATGDAARALADGDLTRRAPVVSHDEVTDLAGHFNHMADRIQALVGGLRRSEQARKDLLVTVSHELRTPITSIAGFAEALRDGVVKGPEGQQRYLQIIATESARLNRLIDDLFDVAKLDAGQVELNLQPIEVATLLDEFTEAFQPTAEAHGVNLALQLDQEVTDLLIYGDRDRLDQVLTNLAGNALRFSPEGETITFRASADGHDLLITVVDQGPGLPPEEAERVFDRFFQGANQGRGHKGAGLGLSIVKLLVEAHGGSVGVESSPLGETAFWIRLRQPVP